ncbi:MAG: hypothetical protein ACK5Q5_19355 [Planctomycetaceae bacterium]
MDHAVQITTGSRLHFGPLAMGAVVGRRFGGIGLMLDEPGVVLRVQRANSDRILASHEDRPVVERCLAQARAGAGPSALPAVSLDVLRSIPRHFGLGSGTQLALATAQAAIGSSVIPASRLARWTERGKRSAIGIYGYESGGFLVDAGKSSPDALGTLAARVLFPADWPIALWMPSGTAGLSGDAERTAFAELAATPAARVDELCGIVLRELLPALSSRGWSEFSQGLRRYGEIVGRQFVSVQGDVWAHPQARDVVDWFDRRGWSGLAQSSWGPTIAVVLPDAAAGRQLVAEWPYDPHTLRMTRARNRGTEVMVASDSASVAATSCLDPAGYTARGSE